MSPITHISSQHYCSSCLIDFMIHVNYRYWYFGPLKSRWTHIRTAMKEWPPTFKAKISYVLATEENTRPVLNTKVVEKQQEVKSKSWFSFLYKTKPIVYGK